MTALEQSPSPAPSTGAPALDIKVPTGRTRVIGSTVVFLGLFALWAFGLGSSSSATTTFAFAPQNSSAPATWTFGGLFSSQTVNVRIWVMALSLLMVALGTMIIVLAAVSWVRRFALPLCGLGAFFFLITLLLWMGRSTGPSQAGDVNFTSLMVVTASSAMVLVYGSLSGIVSERSGVVNIAIEGQLIAGAFAGEVIVSVTHSFWYAALAGMAVGALLSVLLAVFAVRYLADQVIIGVSLVAMMSGLSAYLNLQVLTPYPNYNSGSQPEAYAVPILSKIPIIGPALFDQNAFFYAMIGLCIVIAYALWRTKWGLRVRAVGEHPKAAESVGINVLRIRYGNVIMAGMIAGLGGAAFMSVQGAFNVGYTSGYGYIALAAMIFGRWKVSGAVAACVLFGLCVNLSATMQTFSSPVPSQITSMVPYLVTIAVVAGLVGKVRPPAADGIPYSRN